MFPYPHSKKAFELDCRFVLSQNGKSLPSPKVLHQAKAQVPSKVLGTVSTQKPSSGGTWTLWENGNGFILFSFCVLFVIFRFETPDLLRLLRRVSIGTSYQVSVVPQPSAVDRNIRFFEALETAWDVTRRVGLVETLERGCESRRMKTLCQVLCQRTSSDGWFLRLPLVLSFPDGTAYG